MRQSHKAGVTLLAGLAGLALAGTSLAEAPSSNAPQNAPQNEPQNVAPDTRGGQMPRGKQEGAREEKQKGLGAGVGGQSEKGQGEKGACGPGAGGQAFIIIAPLDTAAMSPEKGYGAGLGGEVNEPGKAGAAPVPHYWLADASLFVANAGNAAQTLANEQSLGVQAPSVLGNQAQFLLASTDRAISSLGALQSNAESSNPRAVADIRAAMDQLNAAKGQAQQVLDAANAGTLGPSHQATIRSAYEHLQTAERDIATVGRDYNAQGYTLAQGCTFRGGRAFGAGLGGKGAPAKKPAQEKTAPEKTAPEKAAPEKAPEPQPPSP